MCMMGSSLFIAMKPCISEKSCPDDVHADKREYKKLYAALLDKALLSLSQFHELQPWYMMPGLTLAKPSC